jgi:hypothetical protein
MCSVIHNWQSIRTRSGVLTVVPAVVGTRSSAHRSPLDDEDLSHARNLAPHFRVRSRRL